MKNGARGLPGGDTLAGLLVRECGYRNTKYLPLTEGQILSWADAHFARVGVWPVANSKPGSRSERDIPEAPGEDWQKINTALKTGGRGLTGLKTGGVSLAQFLAAHRGKRVPVAHTTPLSAEQIMEWAEAHRERRGNWPNKSSGAVEGTDRESWSAINTALQYGGRGLPGGSSLTRLLFPERKQRVFSPRTPLDEAHILAWADAHFQRTGIWPVANCKAGSRSEKNISEAPGEEWCKINSALQSGSRGLPGGSTLARLLAERRGRVLPFRRTTPLSVMQILTWA